MDDMARAEYPGMLANLQPGQAVQVLNDRVKRINKVNIEIADWLQERHRIEEQYVMGLRKLAQFKVPNAQSELGVFQGPWARIIDAVERMAQSHHQFADRMERDVENPLRAFQQRKDYLNMNNISNNLNVIAKDLDDAQQKSDKLNKKSGKANAQKLDAASAKLDTSTQQWESQAPFIFETLQALDESRVNNLRDLLTQYQTHESDQAQRHQDIAVETLASTLEISTEREVQDFVQRTTKGRPHLPTRTSTRRSSVATPQSPMAQPPRSSSGLSNTLTPATSQQPPPIPEDNVSESNPVTEAKPESKLRRLGTVLGGRRRQSVHGGFGQLSPQKGAASGFGRLGPNQGRSSVSPRASSSNLHESSRLSALPEDPDTPKSPEKRGVALTDGPSHGATNGVGADNNLMDAPVLSTAAGTSSTSGVNGTNGVDVSDVPPPAGPPPSQQSRDAGPISKDSDGFNVRAPMNDPISEAQREAAGDDADHPFKLSIQNKPVDSEDPEAAQAALSNVSNSLKMGAATRRSSTIRGRRDVRNTIYVPAPNLSESHSESSMPTIQGSPPMSSPHSKPPALAALASEASVAGTSDTGSVRSGHSLGNMVHAKHPDMTAPGLNCSIIETVSAIFDGDVVKSAAIAGEVAFVNNNPDSSARTHEVIRINNFPKLERIGPNRIFVQNSSPDQPDQFSLDVSHLAKTSIGFSYRVFGDDSDPTVLAQNAPILLKPAWKPQGDKLGLLLQYQLNPSANFAQPLTLHNVVFIATYEGKASGAQTKPTGTHLKEKHLVYWRLGDVALTHETQKIVCRIVGAEGSEPTPGHVEARWEYTASGDEVVGSGISISRQEDAKGKGKEIAHDDDPFADESVSWVDVPLSRKLVSGKYQAVTE